MMSNSFQIEFSLSDDFQSMLRTLTELFSQVAGNAISVNKIVGMCLRALQDITPELVDEFLCEDHEGMGTNIFQKTTNLDRHERQLLDNIKLNFLLKYKRDISRREIMLGLIYKAGTLKKSDIEYIYREYQ